MNRAQEASEATKRESAEEKVKLMLADYMSEKYTGTKTLEEYLKEQKEKGLLDEVINNGDGTNSRNRSQFIFKSKWVIDIVWLDSDNNVINVPMSPANYLGGLTAIKTEKQLFEQMRKVAIIMPTLYGYQDMPIK